jgi:putative hemolysin
VHLLLRTVHAVSDTWVNVALVLVFILIGGVFAATELALVSLREGQAKALAARSSAVRAWRGSSRTPTASWPRAGRRHPRRLPVGGVRCGAPGRARVGPAHRRRDGHRASDTVALVLVTLVISYFSLVFSELAPKRLALQRPEGVSMLFAPALDRIASLARPVIWLLSKSTDLVVRLLGGDPSRRARPSRRRSCATWWRRTSRSPRTSASSSTTSSPPVSASCAR